MNEALAAADVADVLPQWPGAKPDGVNRYEPPEARGIDPAAAANPSSSAGGAGGEAPAEFSSYATGHTMASVLRQSRPDSTTGGAGRASGTAMRTGEPQLPPLPLPPHCGRYYSHCHHRHPHPHHHRHPHRHRHRHPHRHHHHHHHHPQVVPRRRCHRIPRPAATSATPMSLHQHGGAHHRV